MIVRLLAEHHLEFLSLKGGCRGSFESTLVKMQNCWKSHSAAHIIVTLAWNAQNMRILCKLHMFYISYSSCGCTLLVLFITDTITNSKCLDEMARNVIFLQGLHCLQ